MASIAFPRSTSSSLGTGRPVISLTFMSQRSVPEMPRGTIFSKGWLQSFFINCGVAFVRLSGRSAKVAFEFFASLTSSTVVPP